MLNKEGKRELSYLVKIDKIEPIIGSDNCEAAYVGGWHVMVHKNEFNVGDPAVYFEIDSHLDYTKPEFAFLEKKHGNIKTQKYTFGGKGNFISQGLLMPVSAWGWLIHEDEKGLCVLTNVELPIDPGTVLRLDDETRFLTKRLGVTYSDPGDNVRKVSAPDKYKKMTQHHPNIFKKPWAKWLMRREWGRKLMFFLFGKKKDKKNSWPAWVVKTDEERIQNCSWILNDTNREWIATEKIDGSSTTFTVKGFKRKRVFYVCSRNVVFDKPDKKCFYETNIYTEMAEKYDMEKVMSDMLDIAKIHKPDIEFITIQAETYGAGVQKRDYGMKDHDMAIFNVIFGFKDGRTVRLNPIEGEKYVYNYGLPYVPVLGQMTLPDNCEDVLALAESAPSKIDGGMREGIVFRSLDGVNSFKAVSNTFLLKYHG